MITTLRLRLRAAVTGGVAVAIVVASAAPAWADDPMPGSASDTSRRRAGVRAR